MTLFDRLPWALYRYYIRWCMWRNSGPDLNNRVDCERALIKGFTSGNGLNAEQCRDLARRLGVPKEHQ